MCLPLNPRFAGSNPAVGDGFLRAIKIRSTPFFGEVKPKASCRKTLRHVKITCKDEQKYFARPNLSFHSPFPPACYQMSDGRIARDLCMANQEFYSVDIILLWFSVLIYHQEDEK
jgi:hypothetical protein